jgi:hypothetical protein
VPQRDVGRCGLGHSPTQAAFNRDPPKAFGNASALYRQGQTYLFRFIQNPQAGGGHVQGVYARHGHECGGASPL